MSVTLLTVDVGNTAAKLRAWVLGEGGALACTARAEVASRATDSAELARFFDSAPRADFAAVSSVVEPAVTAAWIDRLAAHSRAPAALDLDAGLENRTREPARVGRDRLFAARGALELAESSCLVVNVGTAMTVDAVLALDLVAEPRRGLCWLRGAFLGGAIAPGPWLLARALGGGASQLYAVDPVPEPCALGVDSTGAMQAGIAIGLRGAARELAVEVGRAAHFVDPTVVLAGGARAFAARAFAGERATECPDVVHLGLCAAVLEAAGVRRPAAFGLA